MLSWRGAAFAFSLGISEWFVWRHIFWRDEALGVMIADHSPTVRALLSHMGYEGTPGLWHFLLWITRFLPPWWDLKIWTALVTAAALYAVFYLLDLDWPMATVYALGVQLGTYSFMSRSYGVSVLLLLLFAYSEKRWRRDPVLWNGLLLSVVLFLLTQTNVHSVLIGAGVFLYLSVQNLTKQRPVSWLPVVALGVGAVAAVLQVLPPPDLGTWAGWTTGDEAVSRYLVSLVLLPLRLYTPFYAPNTAPGWANIYGGTWLYGLVTKWGATHGIITFDFAVAVAFGIPFSLGVYLVLLYALRVRGQAVAGVLAVAVPLLLLTALGVFKYPLELQHFYLMVPYVLVLYVIAKPRPKATSVMVWTLLSVHLLSVVLYIGTLVTVPYDGNPDIVDWIETHGYGIYLDKSDVVVFPDPSITTLTLYGGLPNGAYALSAERFETYTQWDTTEPRDVLNTAPPKLPTHLPGMTGPYLLLTYFPGHLDYSSVDAVLLNKFQDGPWVHWNKSPGAYLYLVKSRTS